MREVLLESFQHLESELNGLEGEWIFRGQSDSEWEINSSIYRFFCDAELLTGKKNERYRQDIESNIIDEFSAHAQLYLKDLPNEENPLELLSVMQHYGCPTRLLDVSCSPYIAMYFALDAGTRNAALYAFNSEHFSRINGDKIQSLADAITFLKQGANETSQLALYSPYWRSERIVIQQGLFLVPNTLTKSIDDILDDYCLTDEQAIKFIIPLDKRMQFIRKLLDMNINSSTLYQGLEGFCKSLRNILLHDSNTQSFQRKKTLSGSVQRNPLTIRR